MAISNHKRDSEFFHQMAFSVKETKLVFLRPDKEYHAQLFHRLSTQFIRCTLNDRVNQESVLLELVLSKYEDRAYHVNY